MSELIQVEGEVDFVQYKNDDGSFCVIDVKTEDELIKAVGALGNVEEGEMVILTGEYVNNEVYGRQLRVAMFERSLPTTEASILRYLSSGALESVQQDCRSHSDLPRYHLSHLEPCGLRDGLLPATYL